MSLVRALLPSFLLPLSFVTLAAAEATLPSVDEIVQKYVDARGGLQKIHAIETIKMVGTADINGQMQGEITIETKRPNLFRFDLNLPNGSMVQAFDGHDAWSINPFAGSPAPQKDPSADSQAAKELHDIDGALVDYKAKGNQVEVVGAEDVGGSPAYKLKVTGKSGTVSNVWIDQKTWHEVKMVQSRTINGQETEVEVLLSNFKPVNGVMVPHTYDQKFGPMSMKIEFSSAEANAPVDDALFRMPAAAPATAPAK